ncbi:MAG TPA: 50S ribosomal protein L21 [Bacillota bacterium]|jgi:large subunit ribosomal protein L21|nr:50S ribosomal protein L21 [Bacillota bacterium]
MYAVVETGGKQYKVSEGDILSVEKMPVSAGDKVVLDKVLVFSDGDTLKLGTPYIDGAKVEADVVENGKGDKIIIFKFKAKKDYRKKQGHRQPYTMLKIGPISLDA